MFDATLKKEGAVFHGVLGLRIADGDNISKDLIEVRIMGGQTVILTRNKAINGRECCGGKVIKGLGHLCSPFC